MKRAKYQSKLNEYMVQGFAIAYMDESGFESEPLRPFGYAPIGKPCIDFYDWCKYTLIPSLKTKCVIVMDMSEDKAKHCFARVQGESCARVTSFHKRVQKLLNRHGHRLLFLPPYSPDLNPIEKKWAQAKFLRQGWMENNLPKLFHDMERTNFIVD